MKHFFTALVLSLCVATVAQKAHGAPAAKMADLAWISGQWNAVDEAVVVDAYYAQPAAGTLMGQFRIIESDVVTFYEFERFAEEAGSLVLYPIPNGTIGVPFTLSDIGSDRAVFANPEHPFPKTVTFFLDEGGLLHIRADGEVEGHPLTQEIIMGRGKSQAPAQP